jgi:hypothetical protein
MLGFLTVYQLAFLTPGILPSLASFRKQIRQILNLRYTAFDRPQISHRVYSRTRNFCFLLTLFSNALVDIHMLHSTVPVTVYPAA